MKILIAVLAYGLLFLVLFNAYVNQQRKKSGQETARRCGVILLVVHTVCLVTLLFFVPDSYVAPLIWLSMGLPLGCTKVL